MVGEGGRQSYILPTFPKTPITSRIFWSVMVVGEGLVGWPGMPTYLCHRNINHMCSSLLTYGVFDKYSQNRFFTYFENAFPAGADPGFGQGGGPQLLRPKVADVAKWSYVSILRPGSRACLRALEAFGFLMLKYAFSHILETLFLLFLTSILTPKVDKNRALDLTSINLRHSDMLHLFFNL